MKTIEERKQVEISHTVDVIVAGAGVAGVFAALAAARRGKKTLLIDRFGSPGGNIGPGMIAGGSLSGFPVPHMLHGPFMGIPKEFIERHAILGGGSVPPYRKSHYPRDIQIATRVLFEMLREAEVSLMLSTYICDPIVKDGRVCGVFMESKSGRRAAMAEVVIDATGEADLSRRAGAPVIMPDPASNKIDAHSPSGSGIYYVIGNVNWPAYEEFTRNVPPPTKAEKEWVEKELYRSPPDHLTPILKKASDTGTFEVMRDIAGLGKIGFPSIAGILSRDEGLAGGMLNLKRPWISPETQGKVDAGDGEQMSRLEADLRMYIYDMALFWKNCIPGFENSYLAFVSPFFGTRGGPCVEGDYVMTREDLESGRRFPDVMYIFDHVGDVEGSSYHGQWTDLPYRAMLPKGLEGILAVGRCASCRPDTLLRSRAMVMHMGEVGGTAASLSIDQKAAPRQLDIRTLQSAMLDQGYFLGDRARLRELGLID